MKHLSTLILVLLFSFSSIANSAPAIIVTVFERGSDRPLKRVEARIDTNQIYSDPSGLIEIPEVADETLILFSKSDYEDLFITRKELTENPKVFLMRGEPDDDEIIVSGSKRPEVARKIITTRETSRIAPGGDPAQITKILPGVQSQGFQQEVIIRGSGPNDSRYYVDDYSIGSIFHPIGGLSVLPEQVIDRVDFSSGGFGAQHGEATGGTIILHSKSEIPEKASTDFRFNVPFFTGIFHETPLDQDSALTVSLRHSLTEYIIPKVIEKMDESNSVTVVPTFSDALVRYLTKHDSGHYKVTLLASNDGVVAAVPFETFADESGNSDIDFFNRFATLGVEGLYRLGGGQSIRSTPHIYYGHQNWNIGAVKGTITSTSLNIPTEWSMRIGKKRYVYLGIEPRIVNAGVEITSPKIPPSNDPFYDIEDAPLYSVDRNFKTTTIAMWAALDYNLDELTISPSIRFFNTSQIDKSYLDPRLSMRYALNADHAIKGSFGYYSQPPQDVESSEEFGNPELGFAQATHSIAGIEGKLSDRWSYDIQYFEKKVDHLIRSHPTKNYDDAGTLKVTGGEIFLRRFLTEKMFGWLAYTYSKAKERINSSSPYYVSPYDQTHILNLAWAYKIDTQWEIATRMKYFSGTTLTPITGASYNANLDKFQPRYDKTNPYSDKYPASDSIDVFATYESYYDTWRLSHQFGIQMYSFNKSISDYEYSYDYTERAPAENNLAGVPFYEIRARF